VTPKQKLQQLSGINAADHMGGEGRGRAVGNHKEKKTTKIKEGLKLKGAVDRQAGGVEISAVDQQN